MEKLAKLQAGEELDCVCNRGLTLKNSDSLVLDDGIRVDQYSKTVIRDSARNSKPSTKASREQKA